MELKEVIDFKEMLDKGFVVVITEPTITDILIAEGLEWIEIQF